MIDANGVPHMNDDAELPPTSDVYREMAMAMAIDASARSAIVARPDDADDLIEVARKIEAYLAGT